VHYRQRAFATTVRTDDFYRVFLLPGVDHCGTTFFSTGSLLKPGADLNALVNWVENGRAPATLPTTTRDVGRYLPAPTH
jgi:hypothetical protein